MYVHPPTGYMRYRPEIDGLRSIAVVAVILFHLEYDWIFGGYFGVDVFFVISGYLITSIILKEVSSEIFSMRSFWARRVRRIFPALITVILTCLLLAPFLFFKGDVEALARDALSALFSYANLHAWSSFGDYWGSSAEGSYFLHAWSLSLEEQFYLVYPLLLVGMLRVRFSLIAGLTALVCASFLLFILGTVYNPTAAFYLLPARAWELGCGALLAVNGSLFRFVDNNGRKAGAIAALGLLLIITSYFGVPGSEAINIFAILPVFGSLLVIAFSNDSNLVGKILGWGPMVFVGKVSYSLYLWHWPVIVFFRRYEQSLTRELLVLLLIFCLSLLSYYFVEIPTRRGERSIKLVVGLATATVLMTAFLSSPFFEKKYESAFNQVVFYGLYYDIAPTIPVTTATNESKRDGVVALARDSKFVSAYKKAGIITDSTYGAPQVVVVGESHGAMWAKVVDEIARECGVTASFYTSPGNSPFFDIRDITAQERTKGFSEAERIELASRFIRNLEEWRPRLLIVACRWESISEPDWSRFRDMLSFCYTNEIKVLLLNQPPVIDVVGNRNMRQYLAYLGYAPNGEEQFIDVRNDLAIRAANERLDRYASLHSNVSVFDVFGRFSRAGRALIVKGDDILYYDDDHLSYQGTALLRKELKVDLLKAVER